MGQVIDTDSIQRDIGIPRLPRPIVRGLERMLGATRFEQACAEAGVTKQNTDLPRQVDDLLAALGIAYEVIDYGSPEDARANGPVIFYSNHPYGFADALIGLKLALGRRPDTKVLANATLSGFPFNANHVIWVDLGSGRARSATNSSSLRETLAHLRSGGALLIFPSQVCAHFIPSQGRVTDPPWTAHLVRLIDRTGARAVPMHFAGRNSWRFQLLGMIYPAFRTLLLLREFIGLKGKTVQVRIGQAVTESPQGAVAGTAERTHALRARVYGLAREHARNPTPGTDALDAP